MPTVTYAPTDLLTLNKSGKMKPNANGEYAVALGALNVFNSTGAFYPLEYSDRQFRESSNFIRNIKAGTLYSEYKHPDLSMYKTRKERLERYISLDSDRFSNTLSEVTLDDTIAKKIARKDVPKDAVMIIGYIKPHGPYEKYVEDMIANPRQNLCYSIRCLTEDKRVNGVLIKPIRFVITFDLVYHGGIALAKKHMHPSMETIDEYSAAEALEILQDIDFNEETGFGMESVTSMPSLIDELKIDTTYTPIYTGF
jgi:hypothetical protein